MNLVPPKLSVTMTVSHSVNVKTFRKENISIEYSYVEYEFCGFPPCQLNNFPNELKYFFVDITTTDDIMNSLVRISS